MENLKTYVRKLENALSERTPFNTYNRDILHAAEIVVVGFHYAQQEVYLLSNKLDPVLYGQPRLLNAVSSFMDKRDTKLHILVETKIALSHPLIQLASEKYRKQIKINRVPEEWKEKYRFNFMVVDDFGYRFEYDRDAHSAIVSFHEHEHEHVQYDMLPKMKEFFRELEARAKPHPLDQEIGVRT